LWYFPFVNREVTFTGLLVITGLALAIFGTMINQLPSTEAQNEKKISSTIDTEVSPQ
jgi:hypothetical protein